MHLSNDHRSTTDVPCCVILAAGAGRRLSMLGKGPKPTNEILGLSLGERTVLACMAAGVSRFIIVLGSQRRPYGPTSRRCRRDEGAPSNSWWRPTGSSATA